MTIRVSRHMRNLPARQTATARSISSIPAWATISAGISGWMWASLSISFGRHVTTLGSTAHLHVGVKYGIWKVFSVGASGYDNLPTGQQTVFSKVQGGSSNSLSSHKPVFLNNQQTTGTADIAHDDGFSTW